MDKRISQEEMNALLKGKAASGKAGGPMSYDFRRPDRLSKAMLESLRTIHEKFAGSVAAGIASRLRSTAEVSLSSIEQLTYADFLSTLPETTYVAAVAISPVEATAGLQCNLDLSFNLIDRLTGGSGTGLTSESRKITEIERTILEDIVAVWIRNLGEAWCSVSNFHFHISGSDMRPDVLQIADPDGIMIVAAFAVKIEQLQSQIQICIPFSILEPLKAKLEKDSGHTTNQAKADSLKAFGRLLRAPVQLTAELPTTKIPLKELREIAVNDVVILDVKLQDSIVMNVAGRRSFRVSLVQSDGQKSVKLIGLEEGSRN